MDPLAVYVHIPFCTIRCGYCDFNVYAGMDKLKPAYAEAVVREVAHWSPLLSRSRVTSVFFGGGTPSEMAPSSIASILDAIRDSSGEFDGDAEVTIEANPGTTSAGALGSLRRSGVNRVSFGAQSFDGGELGFLDRIHSPKATEASIRLARAAGFDNLSLDLIYGLPGQTVDAVSENLERALALDPDHLSAYALTVEEGTALARRVDRGEVVPAEADLVSEMYDWVADRLASTELAQYELSNWSRPGFESQHNLVYWTDRDYLGLGAGAHGYLDGERYENEPHPKQYVESLASGHADGAAVNRYRPDTITAIADWLGTRLRLLTGFENTAFEAKFGRSIDAVIGPPLARAVEAGVVERTDTLTRLTRRGRAIHSEVVVNVMAYLEALDPALLPSPPGAG